MWTVWSAYQYDIAFDFRILKCYNIYSFLQTSLRLLNISGLKLSDLNLLKSLPHLVEVIAADNNFVNSEYIASSISQLSHLRSATFSGCPAHKDDIYYRNKIILESKSLGLAVMEIIEKTLHNSCGFHSSLFQYN